MRRTRAMTGARGTLPVLSGRPVGPAVPSAFRAAAALATLLSSAAACHGDSGSDPSSPTPAAGGAPGGVNAAASDAPTGGDEPGGAPMATGAQSASGADGLAVAGSAGLVSPEGGVLAQGGEGAAGEGGTDGGAGGGGAGGCFPGDVEVRACGSCGTEERLCLADGTFDLWSPCQHERSNPSCSVGETIEAVPCFRCSTSRLLCDETTCTFTSEGCFELATTECAPGSFVLAGDCPNPGEIRAYPCGTDCRLGPPGDCTGAPLASAVKLAYQKRTISASAEVFFVDWDHRIPPQAGTRTLAGTPGLTASQWSSDGAYLAFVSTEDDRLYVFDLSQDETLPSSGYARLGDSASVTGFAWSGSGSRLAFVNRLGQRGLWIADVQGPFTSSESLIQDLAGTKLIELEEGRAGGLAWSADEKWLSLRFEGEAQVVSTAARASNAAAARFSVVSGLSGTITDRPESACRWSPAGAALVCLANTGIWHAQMLPDAAPDVRLVLPAADLAISSLADLAWLGSSRLLLRAALVERPELFVLDLESEPPLLSTALNAPLPRTAQVGAFRVRDEEVFFEADGALWRRRMGAEELDAAPQLLAGDPTGVVRTEGPRWRVVVPDGKWDVAPDGTAVAFAANWLRPEVYELFSVTTSDAHAPGVEGAEPAILDFIGDYGELRFIAFAPDSRHVAYFTKEFSQLDSDPLRLSVVAVSGGDVGRPLAMQPLGEGVDIVDSGSRPNFLFAPGR